MRIVFDYGGVISGASRTERLRDALCADAATERLLRDFMRSDFVREAATGQHDSGAFARALAATLGRSPDEAAKALHAATTADPEMLALLADLASRHTLYLISDSLPPYSDYIEANLAPYFAAMFLSDRLGCRKSGDLFQRAGDAIPGLYDGAIYIDDRAENLAYPSAQGAHVLLYRSTAQLRRELAALGTG